MTHGMYDIACKCGELELLFFPPAGGYRNQ